MGKACSPATHNEGMHTSANIKLFKTRKQKVQPIFLKIYIMEPKLFPESTIKQTTFEQILIMAWRIQVIHRL